MTEDLKAIKINNPIWMGYLSPQIKTFAEKINIPTITHETLYSYFTRTVQHGGEVGEFWAVVNSSNEVYAFAHWFVCDLPHRGVVFCDFINSWNRMREPVQLLLDEFIAFGKKKNAPIYKGTAVNESIFRVFRAAASKRGYNLNRSTLVDFLGAKNNV